MDAEPEEDVRFLEWVYRWMNVKEHRVTIEQSEREATEAAHLAKLKRQQDRDVHRLKGLVILSDKDDVNHGSSSYDSDNFPPAIDSYGCTCDRKGKWHARKW
ncbi:hypothetical protein D1007_57373 [Hordeum vulgare]|nr:hypothetical protein D1007_57373 [Hordeum vulgare]